MVHLVVVEDLLVVVEDLLRQLRNMDAVNVAVEKLDRSKRHLHHRLLPFLRRAVAPHAVVVMPTMYRMLVGTLHECREYQIQ